MTSMNRLLHEHLQLSSKLAAALPELDHIQHFSADTELRTWFFSVRGPKNSPYSGGVFVLEVSVGEKYPYLAPSMRFVPGKVPFHPNICYKTGSICMDILKDSLAWSPVTTIEGAVLCVVSLLTDVNEAHGLNQEALELYRRSIAEYEDKVLLETMRMMQALTAEKRAPLVLTEADSGSVTGSVEVEKESPVLSKLWLSVLQLLVVFVLLILKRMFEW